MQDIERPIGRGYLDYLKNIEKDRAIHADRNNSNPFYTLMFDGVKEVLGKVMLGAAILYAQCAAITSADTFMSNKVSSKKTSFSLYNQNNGDNYNNDYDFSVMENDSIVKYLSDLTADQNGTASPSELMFWKSQFSGNEIKYIMNFGTTDPDMFDAGRVNIFTTMEEAEAEFLESMENGRGEILTVGFDKIYGSRVLVQDWTRNGKIKFNEKRKPIPNISALMYRKRHLEWEDPAPLRNIHNFSGWYGADVYNRPKDE